MILPNNPKVAIIDDKYEEVKPVFKFLSKQGVPYVYYDGEKDCLPKVPLSDLRIIFSDINIRDNQLGNKNISGEIVSYISKIVEKNNHSFLLVFWTQNESLIPEVKKYLEFAGLIPVDIITIEKPSSEITIEEFSKLITNKLENHQSYEVISYWENFISLKVSEYTNNLCDTIASDSKEKEISWEDSAKNVFYSLANAYCGNVEDVKSDDNKVITFSIDYLNKIFINSLTGKNNFIPVDIKFNNISEISLLTLSKLNGDLFFSKNESSDIENGKIFYANNISMRKLLLKNIFDNKLPEKYKPEIVGLILTPSCDIAHPRYLRNEEDGYHRVLYGLRIVLDKDDNNYQQFLKSYSIVKNKYKLIDENTSITPKEKAKLKKCIRPMTPMDLFITQPFIIFGEEEISILIFHFSSITTERIIANTTRFFLKINERLISDIQSKLANHINRIGNDMLEFF